MSTKQISFQSREIEVMISNKYIIYKYNNNDIISNRLEINFGPVRLKHFKLTNAWDVDNLFLGHHNTLLEGAIPKIDFVWRICTYTSVSWYGSRKHQCWFHLAEQDH